MGMSEVMVGISGRSGARGYMELEVVGGGVARGGVVALVE